jgi:hypothetical protein
MIDFQFIEDLSVYRTAIPEVRRLFEEVFERQFPSDIWDQWYFRNPYGDPLVVMGFSGGRAVAHQAFIPQRLVNAEGTVLPYVLSISSMVERRWRNWTVFNRMMTLLHEESAKRDCPLIVVLPNTKSRELYRVLYNYRTVIETPLCSWIPKCDTHWTAAAPEEVALTPAEDFSYPTDARYWRWRVTVNGARCWKLTDSLRVVAKVTAERVLTVLDILGGRGPDYAPPLGSLARSLKANCVRLTAFHANALGIREQELLPHEGYSVRLACRSLSGEPPRIRFSLLLSDVF